MFISLQGITACFIYFIVLRVYQSTRCIVLIHISGVERLAGMSLSSPVKIDMSADQSSSKRDELITDKIAVPENLKHHCVIVPSKLRLVTLAAFILWKCKV